MTMGRVFDPFDPRLLSIKLDVVLNLNGLEVRTLSHCISYSLRPQPRILRAAGRRRRGSGSGAAAADPFSKLAGRSRGTTAV
ncbi:hypothetical protein SFRURICE_004101 [Spodoptera frugiperda]|nr:hypothetical protein SFRURICE_004101 [Spodoptera frugiperda]